MNARTWPSLLSLVLLALLLSPEAAWAQASAKLGGGGIWPTWDEFYRVVSLRDYNTRIVFLGTTLLGAAGGLVGTFLLLRKRSLLSDTVSHATLPGIAVAFIVGEMLGGDGKSLPILLLGATVAGVLGMLTVVGIRTYSRIKDDAALAIVLSVFFGFGICLTVIIQQMPSGNAAGIMHYIYGRAASMTGQDALLIAIVSGAIAVGCALFFKEFALLCFDQDFAATQGWPVTRLDILLMCLVVAVTVIGLQSVGLLLVVAMLIIPPASARFWSERLGVNALLAAALGAASGFTGVLLSALFPKLPAGAVIVLAATFYFALSMVFGLRRGVLVRSLEQFRVVRRVERQHLMRTFYESLERQGRAVPQGPVPPLERAVRWDELLMANHVSVHHLKRILRRAERDGLVVRDEPGQYRLTPGGQAEAKKIVRNHRLWELYLIEHADVAPNHVHRDADLIEHVLDPRIVRQLEALLAKRSPVGTVPSDPERLAAT
ncbi:MAG: metal ABC transporter permease [Verrucomicrobiota bacterium]